MARKQVEQPEPERTLNRKELSRAQRQMLARNRILIATATLLGLVLVVLAAGLVQTQLIAPGQPVARVEGEEISTRDYQQRVQFNRWQLRNALLSAQAQLTTLPADDPSVDFLRQIYQQQAQRLQQQYTFVGSQTLEEVIEGSLIRKRAAELNITVTDEEVTTEIERQVAQGLGAIRTADATATATAGVAATATAAGFTPTPTFEPTPTLDPTARAAITQTATPFPPTSVPEATPTINYLNVVSFTTQYNETIKDLTDRTGITEPQYREYVRVNLLREKLQEYYADQAPTEEEQINVNQLIFNTEDEANAARARIDEGDDFETLSNEEAAKTAGDLGFITRDQVVEPFSNAAFELEVDEISDPVETEFGWHIIQVLERDEEGGRVRARHILVETEEEAQEIKEELDEGADFGTLALERSRDATPPQTSLGWISRDSSAADPAVVEAAFGLKAGDISQPIRIGGDRYALIEVTEGPEVRTLDETALQQRQQEAFQTWLNEAKAAETVERIWDESKVPSDPFARDLGL